MKEIALKKGGVALVDDEDFEHLSKWAWTNNNGYASRTFSDGTGQWKRVYMHRVIMGTPAKKVTDHIDHNPLNNQKENLRLADCSTNARNKLKQKTESHSVYKGVSKSFSRNGNFSWQAIIGIGQKKNRRLGCYRTEIEAALAYDFAAVDLYGEFACLNKYSEGLAV